MIFSDDAKRKKPRFRHAVFLVVASIRMRNLVVKWRKVRESLEEKQKRKQTPSTCHSSQLTEHRALTIQNGPRNPLRTSSWCGLVGTNGRCTRLRTSTEDGTCHLETTVLRLRKTNLLTDQDLSFSAPASGSLAIFIVPVLPERDRTNHRQSV